MARKFTPLYTSIWQDEDFTSLDPTVQALFFTLISQPNINSVGLLPITQRRWRGCAEWKMDVFDAAMDALIAARFVMVAEDTEELLVRTFVKWDGGFKHPLRLKSIIKDAQAIQSPSLRTFMVAELGRLGLTVGTVKAPPSDESAYTEGTAVPSVPVLTLGDKQGNLELRTLNLEEGRGNALEPGDDTPPNEFCDKHMPDGTDEPCGKCAGRRKRHERQLTQRQQRQTAARSQLAAARARCPDCNPAGWLEDSDGKPTIRCKHPGIDQPETTRPPPMN